MTTSAAPAGNWCPSALNSLMGPPPPLASRELSTSGSPQARLCIPLGGGRWLKGTVLPTGTYEYYLVVDGQWMGGDRKSVV